LFDKGASGNFIIEYHGKNIVDGIFGNISFRPRIKICSAMQNQYILDHFGGIYKCWWGMGNKQYSVGNFSKEIIMDENDEMQYLKRRIYLLEKCKSCKYRYVCGGGCSGRLSRKSISNGDVICPDFEKIFQYVIPKKYDMLKG